MKNRNNRLLVCAAAAFAFLCAIPLQWFTVTNATMFGETWPGSLSVTGINGHVGLLFQAPIWLLLAISTFATGIAAANLLGATTVPKTVPAIMLLFSGAHYLTPFFLTDDRLSTSVGPILAIAATAVALLASLSAVEVVSAQAPVD